MNKETNARGQRLVGASRHVGSLVALVAGGLLHHKDFRHAQVHPKDRATVYIIIGYNKQFYVSYGIVRERGVNRRREVDFVVPPLCATLLHHASVFAVFLSTPEHRYMFPPSSLCIR